MVVQHELTKTFLREYLTIYEYEFGLLYKSGRYIGTLEPGHYRFWGWERASVTRISKRLQNIVVQGQEMLTADKVDIRVTLAAQYRVTDPEKAINDVEYFQSQLYQDLQLILREAVSAHELDTLLNERDRLSTDIQTQAVPLLAIYGIGLERVGVKDIILPGPLRTIMLQELMADREGRADLVRARHEVAAARARANVAKLLADNPQLARLQELEALGRVAHGSGNIVVLPNLSDLMNG